MAAVILMLFLGSLSDEVNSFLAEYQFNGYSVQWSRAVYLPVNEPCTVQIYPGPNLEGVVCGVGGAAILDLRLELHGGGLDSIDSGPDDMPVLRFVSGAGVEAYSVTVTAVDMLFGASADSAYIFFALRPIHEDINSIPAVPDSAITGE